MAEFQLVIVEGANAGREFDLTGGIIAGRDQEAGIVLEDSEASRKHASLSVGDDGFVTVDDLGSTNGTYVNGERLSSSRRVADGDRVRVGTTVFEVRSLVQATQVGTAIPDEPVADPQATRVGGTAVPDLPPEPTEPMPPPQPAPAAAAPASAPPLSSMPPPGGGPAGGAPPPSFPPPAPGPADAGPAATGFPPPQPGGFGAPGVVPAPHQQGGLAAGGYPIEFDADYPSGGIARWRCFFQGFLLIPHFFALMFVGIAAYFAIAIAWFAIVFTRRYPRGLFNFVAGTFRWAQRATGYSYLMTERWPPFSMEDEPSYPIRTRFAYPEGGIARWRPFLQGFMAIPHFIALYLVSIAAFVALIIAWFAILFTRNYPRGMFDFIAGTMRWNARVGGYVLLMTEEYPPFSLR